MPDVQISYLAVRPLSVADWLQAGGWGARNRVPVSRLCAPPVRVKCVPRWFMPSVDPSYLWCKVNLRIKSVGLRV